MIRLGSLWYNCIYWSRFETLSSRKSSAISDLVIIRLACTKANSYSNFVLPSHLQLTCVQFTALQCVIPFRCLKLQVLFDSFLLSFNRLSCHLLSIVLAKYICTFPGSSTPYTCDTIVCSGFNRRSTQTPGWVFTIFWETPFTLRPWSAIAHSAVSPFARSVYS